MEYVYQDLSGRKLTKSDFTKYVEKKIAKTISEFKLIQDSDVIGVALSGGKDSLVLLYALAKHAKTHHFTLKAVAVDEGIKGYREKTLPKAKELCEKLGVELSIVSYKETFGKPLDDMIHKGMYPCSVCGSFRRKLLNKTARELSCSKLALGHNLDDEAQAILMNNYKHNIHLSARMGPITGSKEHDGFVRRIKPLYLLTEKEIMTYAFIHGLTDDFTECPYVDKSFRRDVQEQLNQLEEKHPGSKQGIVQSFLQVIPLLQKQFASTMPVVACEKCGEPCSSVMCNACKMEEKLNL